MAKPLVKWVGGKRQLLEQMKPYLPTRIRRYCEPFVGGGALFFHLAPERALLSDMNGRLIRMYRGVRDSPEQVIKLLQSYPHDKAFFLSMREVNIDDATDAEVSAWFIYLNKTGFNGLYRVNKQNRFNVPFGAHKNPTICDEENIRACSSALKLAELITDDFQSVMNLRWSMGDGDFVYFDPPYVPLSATSSFTSYTSDGFDMDDQRRLVIVARYLKERGVSVLLSNSGAPAVKELYAGFELIPVKASRMINSKADQRGEVTEYLIR